MRTEELTMTGLDGKPIAAYRWTPPREAKAVVQIVHGMAEHARRYVPLARVICAGGYAVFAQDLRGHGRSIQRPRRVLPDGSFAPEDTLPPSDSALRARP